MDIKFNGISFAGIEALGVQVTTNDDGEETKKVYRLKVVNVPLLGYTAKTQKNLKNAPVSGELNGS